MTGAIHYLRTRASGLYIVVWRPAPETSRYAEVLGVVARIGRDRWEAFGLNSRGAADVRALGPRVCCELRRYQAGEALYESRKEA